MHVQMDFRSRDLCRREVEDFSRRSGREEEDVVSVAVRLATERAGRPGTDPREGTVGYFLIGDGRLQLETEIGYRPTLRRAMERHVLRHALPAYLLVIAITTILLSLAAMLIVGAGPPWWWLAVTGLAVLLVASRTAVSLVNWCASLLAPPRALPRLDFSKGIPEAHRTAVIVPAMLSSAATVDRLLENLELRYLGNRGPNLLMVLLTDLPDALQEQMPEDKPLLDRASTRIRESSTPSMPDAGKTVFHLLHRPRLWNPQQRRWMGHERKRGKIEDFNRLVLTGATESFSLIEGGVAQLRGVRYGIVLDADTQLPPQAAWKMVASMAHPLNRPHVDTAHQCVTRGYGILQPRLAVSLPQSQRSRFAGLYAGDVGLDPYTREVSNVYQDLFGQGQFVGKAIYDIEAFDAAVSARFPDNRILSHDLIEGCHARCGFLSDVELLEDHPERYLADASRRRRWARGDWQIARWLLPCVPGPDKTRRPNPLGTLAKWMILDNLRRTLVPAAVLAALLLGWFGEPSAALPWTVVLVIVFLLPDLLRIDAIGRVQTQPPEMVHPSALRGGKGTARLGNQPSGTAADPISRRHVLDRDLPDSVASGQPPASIGVADGLRRRPRGADHPGRHVPGDVAGAGRRRARRRVAGGVHRVGPHARRDGIDPRRGPAPGRMVRLAGDHVVHGKSDAAPRRRHRRSPADFPPERLLGEPGSTSRDSRGRGITGCLPTTSRRTRPSARRLARRPRTWEWPC